MDDSQASAAESQAPPPPSSPPIQEEDSGDDDNLQSKVQKLMEKITSSPDNPNPSVLHALSSILEAQESRYPSHFFFFVFTYSYFICFDHFVFVVFGFRFSWCHWKYTVQCCIFFLRFFFNHTIGPNSSPSSLVIVRCLFCILILLLPVSRGATGIQNDGVPLLYCQSMGHISVRCFSSFQGFLLLSLQFGVLTYGFRLLEGRSYRGLLVIIRL